MKKYTILAFMFLSTVLFAQQTKINDLELLLPNLSGIERVDTLTELSLAYSNVLPEKGLAYGDNGLRLSIELDYKKGKAEALKNIGLNHWSQSNYDPALEYELNALKIFEQINDGRGTANTLIVIGNVYSDLGTYLPNQKS